MDCDYKWTSVVDRYDSNNIFCTNPTMDKLFCDKCNIDIDSKNQRVLDETWRPFIDNCNQHFKGLDTAI